MKDLSVIQFPYEIKFPTGNEIDFAQAADAIKQEYRASVKWMELRCREVTTTEDPCIFQLLLGYAIEFDWSWEGATAFRPLKEMDSLHFSEDQDQDETNVWFGEVVEVDEAEGIIFVWVDDSDKRPVKGTFFIRPFEFLAHLHSVFNDPASSNHKNMLSERLQASRGDIHPPLGISSANCLHHLKGVWAHGWSAIWGPPGTGKTYTVGQQVVTCLADPNERILVVSTTNRSTDESAFAIGRALLEKNVPEKSAIILRIGKGAHLDEYRARHLERFLNGTETLLLQQVGQLHRQLHATVDIEVRAILRKQMQMFKRAMKDASLNAFASAETRVVVATAHRAMSLLNDKNIRAVVSEGHSPFTTVFIDEAGLISRVAASALSLLASRRVILAGDSKQLAPISKISRVLPTSKATWLASSGLSHLRTLSKTHEAVRLLREQHRMHPHVASVVSNYQYEGKLEDGETVKNRAFHCPEVLSKQPRSIWYVLDEDGDDLSAIRAERGPGNRSFIRAKTRTVLKKLFVDETMRKTRGLFISPYMAQARDIRAFFVEEGIETWSSSTVHSQQGTEADIVIFDTVNAGNTSWPLEEWKRLVNVGLSRARQFIIVLASRAEMREPYLKPLTTDLSAQVLRRAGSASSWTKVKSKIEYEIPNEIAENRELLGHQISTRKELRPIMSAEQQRLCGYSMDGKPRLVRGVAGSGKTTVLANWLLKTLKQFEEHPDWMIWIVFANRSLLGLIRQMIEESWESEGNDSDFPWQRVHLFHIQNVLSNLNVELPKADQYDYDAASMSFLRRVKPDTIKPRCHAMFLDEAQDMGPATIELLTKLVFQTDSENVNSRSINIFYDNAQNIYGRRTPKWSDMGLDMRGRSFVMEESFRSTKPITEFALNVLYLLRPEELNGDHKELVERGLIELMKRAGEKWWKICFNQTDGPSPIIRQFSDRSAEFDAVGNQLVTWIKNEGIKPTDICLIYNSPEIKEQLENRVAARLRTIGVQLEVQVSKQFNRDANTVIATTANSYKGYDSEVVMVVGADMFQAVTVGILANNLYVAMTRARSLLAVFGCKIKDENRKNVKLLNGSRIMSVLTEALDLLNEVSERRPKLSTIVVENEILLSIDAKHRNWLKEILKQYSVCLEPIITDEGEIIAEPTFWFECEGRRFACYSEEVKQSVRHRLEDKAIRLLLPGESVQREAQAPNQNELLIDRHTESEVLELQVAK